MSIAALKDVIKNLPPEVTFKEQLLSPASEVGPLAEVSMPPPSPVPSPGSSLVLGSVVRITY